MSSKKKLQIIQQTPQPEITQESETDNELEYKKPITKPKNKKTEEILQTQINPIHQPQAVPQMTPAPNVQYIYVQEPPKRKKMNISEEEKQARAERLKQAREKRKEMVNVKNQEQTRLLELYKEELEKKEMKKLERMKKKAQRDYMKQIMDDEMDNYVYTDTEDNGGRRGGSNAPPSTPVQIPYQAPPQPPRKKIIWS